MSKAIPVTIGLVEFPTQKAASEHYSAMLSRYPDEGDVTGKDFDDLSRLIEYHPDYHTKFAGGVKRFFRAKTKHGVSCFWIERMDGKKDDFSIGKCIKGAREAS